MAKTKFKISDRAGPIGLTRQSKAKTMTYSPGKRKAINDFVTGRPNISTSKFNTMLSTKSKSNAPGGNISRPIRKVAQKKKTPSNAPGGMMKPMPGPVRKQPAKKKPMPGPVMTRPTGLSKGLTPAKRAEILRLRERIKSLQGNPVSPRLKRKRK